MARAESGLAPAAEVQRPARGRPGRRALACAAAAFALALAAYAADVATHPVKLTLGWFDLNIYNHAGLIVRHAPDTLYTWHFLPGVQYLYTPFAALGFAAGSLLPWAVLRWLMTVVSLAALTGTVWFTLGALGWRGRARVAALLALTAVASAVFAGTVVVGFAALPHDSVKWWLTGYFLHAGDFSNTSQGSLLNQSLLALVTRTPAGTSSVTALWLLLAVVIGCLGLAAAVLFARTGRPTAGWVTCAVTGVLVSPISWDNHWVWIVPVLVLLTDAAVRASGAARAGYLGLGAALAAVFADWPIYWTGRLDFVPHGLVGFHVGRHPMSEIFHLSGVQLISWNLYVLAGLALFAGLLVAAALTWRDRRAAAVS